MNQRKVFFEDEIDYFRETAISILNKFMEGQCCIEATEFLTRTEKKIKSGLPIDEIIKIIDFENMCEKILNQDKKGMIRLKFNNKVMEEELEKTACELKSSAPLKELVIKLTNLLHAAQDKHLYLKEHQEELIKIEKDESQQCDCDDNSRLLLVMEKGKIDQALDFINRGMFINRANEFGQTPLMLAAKLGSDILIEALLAKGADLNAHKRFDRPFETALYVAIRERKQSAATLLMRAGAEVNFELKTYLSNKSEIFCLTDLAKKFDIDLNTISSQKFVM